MNFHRKCLYGLPLITIVAGLILIEAATASPALSSTPTEQTAGLRAGEKHSVLCRNRNNRNRYGNNRYGNNRYGNNRYGNYRTIRMTEYKSLGAGTIWGPTISPPPDYSATATGPEADMGRFVGTVTRVDETGVIILLSKESVIAGDPSNGTENQPSMGARAFYYAPNTLFRKKAPHAEQKRAASTDVQVGKEVSVTANGTEAILVVVTVPQE